MTTPSDPLALLRSKSYLALLVLAAIIGVPVSAAAYFFLALVPMITLGGGLGVLAVRLVKRDAPPRTATVMAAAGTFAAISTLLGSPLLGAFLLMEASGLGGATLELVLVPGLLAAGVGSLVFIGLDAWTGLGTFSLAIPGLPHVGSPTGAEFSWAVAIGVMAAPLGSGIRWLGLFLRPAPARGSSEVPRPGSHHPPLRHRHLLPRSLRPLPIRSPKRAAEA